MIKNLKNFKSDYKNPVLNDDYYDKYEEMAEEYLKNKNKNKKSVKYIEEEEWRDIKYWRNKKD